MGWGGDSLLLDHRPMRRTAMSKGLLPVSASVGAHAVPSEAKNTFYRCFGERQTTNWTTSLVDAKASILHSDADPSDLHRLFRPVVT